MQSSVALANIHFCVGPTDGERRQLATSGHQSLYTSLFIRKKNW